MAWVDSTRFEEFGSVRTMAEQLTLAAWKRSGGDRWLANRDILDENAAEDNEGDAKWRRKRKKMKMNSNFTLHEAILNVETTGNLMAHFQVKPTHEEEVVRSQPKHPELRKLAEEDSILEEAHSSAYTMHPESTKMYKTLKRQKANGLLCPLLSPEWKWEHITMYILFGLPKTPSDCDGT
ncbi:DNA/RNA polymerases superfamily protein [Cucumis melo var. makuwa]|uniref:DNA/RNA polymerases superfamily protein n=1 Tax=Cucumis melo var. makuwa TaxID=1194695 RepID=A0A5D3BHY3_CUCMM|nr:DNA/RNA polymerases superfamily protein [Cucumis melo var. makuwa]TYJ98654.1 DNA/RNA polymerases superfamily protein [Cucumis melo var. makuwa]